MQRAGGAAIRPTALPQMRDNTQIGQSFDCATTTAPALSTFFRGGVAHQEARLVRVSCKANNRGMRWPTKRRLAGRGRSEVGRARIWGAGAPIAAVE